MLNQIPPYLPFNTQTIYTYRYILLMAFVVLLVFFFCEWTNNRTRQYSPHIKQGINEVVREASKLGTNAKNTTNPFLSVLQDTEALGMVKALKMIAPEDDIGYLTSGVPVNEME